MKKTSKAVSGVEKLTILSLKRELKSGNEQKGIELLEKVIKNKDSKRLS